MTAAYTLRDARPEDMPHIVQRHKDLYSTEYNYNSHFVDIVSQVTADFIANDDPVRERCWVAERDGEFLGCIMLVKDQTTTTAAEPSTSALSEPESPYRTAKLRLLLVEPRARGLGLGRDLVSQCTRFARSARYERIRLWTNGELVSARRLYMREGYRLLSAEEDDSLGVKVVAETWEMEL